jgi:hypothetical protein
VTRRQCAGSIPRIRQRRIVFHHGPLLESQARLVSRVRDGPEPRVVLRYAKRTIVITPHDPQHFIMRAGTFIKVAGFPK